MTKTDHARVKGLLTEAIRMLCKSSLPYKSELNIEGLIGITLDNNDIFLVNINESVVTDHHQTSTHKVLPPKSVKRSLPNHSLENNAPVLPNATSISSLPGTRLDRESSLVEKRMQQPNGDMVTGTESSLMDVKTEILNQQNDGGPVISSLDFGDMLAKYEPDEDQRINPDPNFTSDMDDEHSVDNTKKKPDISYEYGYDDQSSHVDATQDDDIVVVKEEMASRVTGINNTIVEHSEVDPMSSNLLTHDEYLTTFDSSVCYENNLKQTLPMPVRRGRSPRGRGGPYSPYNLKPTNAIPGSSQGQQQVIINYYNKILSINH